MRAPLLLATCTWCLTASAGRYGIDEAGSYAGPAGGIAWSPAFWLLASGAAVGFVLGLINALRGGSKSAPFEGAVMGVILAFFALQMIAMIMLPFL